jgi:hypothetical protein
MYEQPGRHVQSFAKERRSCLHVLSRQYVLPFGDWRDQCSVPISRIQLEHASNQYPWIYSTNIIDPNPPASINGGMNTTSNLNTS